jgi:hypothetical protein
MYMILKDYGLTGFHRLTKINKEKKNIIRIVAAVSCRQQSPNHQK